MVKLLNILQKLTRKIPFIYYIIRKTIGSNSYLSYFFYDNELYYLKKLKKNLKIIDVGSNDGIFVKLIKKIKIKEKIIYCFEPNPNNYNVLKKIKHTNLKIFVHGLGEKNCTKYLYIPYYKFFIFNLYLDSYSSVFKSIAEKNIIVSFGKYFYKKIKYKKEKILIKKLDDFKLKPNFIKMIAGGFEYQIIKGGIKTIKKYKPIIYMDPHEKKVQNLLYKLNYKKYFYNFKKKKIILVQSEKKNIDNYFYIYNKIN